MAKGTYDLLNLDPDTAKASLIEFMKSQDLLKSYAYDGSVMNELLHVLGVNTYKLMFYYNMINAESWLDSAQLRSSVVSHAKDLNYLPRSAHSAKAIIDMTIETDGEINVITLPKGTTFSGRIGTSSFNFSTSETTTAMSSNGVFTVTGLEVYEGSYVYDSYVVDYSLEPQRFLITNKMVDTSSITVTVTEDSGASVYDYTLKNSLLGVTSQSLNYFLQCNENEHYEILFGDDLFGRKPKNGAVVTIQYRVCAGDLANGVQAFSLNRDVTNGHILGQPSVLTTLASAGGSMPEDIESIRFMAPRHFETQERAVGETDYETLLMEAFPEIQAVSAFGGETLKPPKYGRTYVSVRLQGMEGLPESKKTEYYTFLKPKAASIPVFTTPETLFLRVESIVNYNINQTTLTPVDIKSLVAAKAVAYNNEFLDNFKVKLRSSKFIAAIDDAHDSIVSNETDLFVYKKVVPELGVKTSLVIDLVVPLYDRFSTMPPKHLTSESHAFWTSPFYMNGSMVRLEDDGDGNVVLVKMSGGYDSKLSVVGTVEYSTGIVRINSWVVDSLNGSFVNFYGKPLEKDVEVVGNNILTLEPDELNITVVRVQE